MTNQPTNSKMNPQSKNSINFQIGYEFQCDRLSPSIFKHVTDDFILPVYVQRYCEKVQQQKKEEDKIKLQFRIIDYKILKKSSEGSLEFLFHDQEQFLRMKKIGIQQDLMRIKVWETGVDNINKELKKGSKNLLKGQILKEKYIRSILFQHRNTSFMLFRFPKRIINSKQTAESEEQQIKYIQNFRVLNQRYQTDIIVQFNKLNEDLSYHIIQIQYYSCSAQITKEGLVEVSENNVFDPKMELIQFNISGIDFLMQNNRHLLQERSDKFLQCQILSYKNVGNEIKYLYRGFQMKQNVKMGCKHYDLAFQGGGAKGFAYVGAYKAIKQLKLGNQQIKIGSIIGSSAGGITAIAASTGVSYREIEQLCYKMDDIPKHDKITCRDKAFDQYGNRIKFKYVQSKIKELFVQFGIFNQATSSQIIETIKQKVNEIQDDLLNYLKIAAPNIADIFQKEEMVQKTEGWLFWKKTVLKHQMNWDGLLLHGALMKGQFIHNIAAQCLVKYLLKQSYYPDFKKKLTDALADYFGERRKRNNANAEKIMNLIEDYRAIHVQMQYSSIKSLWRQIQDKQQEIKGQGINKFIIFIINKVMFMMNQFLEDNQKQLNINNIDFTNKLKYSPKFKYKRAKLSKIILYIKLNLHNKLNYSLDQQFKNLKEDIGQDYQMKCGLTINYIDDLIKAQRDFFQKIKKIDKYVNQGCYDGAKQAQLSLGYYFKFMYIYRYIEKQFQIITEQKQYFKLQNKLRNLQNLDRVLSCTSYNQINSQAGLINLLNCKHFIQEQENKTMNIVQFVASIFKGSYPEQAIVFNNQNIQHLICNNLYYKQDTKTTQFRVEQIKRSFVFELCDQISETQNQAYKQNYRGVLSRKKQIFNKLIQEVSKITLKQYYNINPIQLTFTSVDLDNKILRFLNHKTTPNLPICRAVQMTGSFPFAFKALKWKEQWGYYYIHHLNKKIAVNLTDHQFTDGGLLANFPIRYFDNQTIRKCYFSHSQQQENQILLGFGLDEQKQKSYEKPRKESKEILKRKLQNSIALQQIQKYFTKWFKIKEGFKVFFNSRWFNNSQNSSQWLQFNTKIVEQIPLLRFLTKILSAYPNADRSLNLQAFSQSVLTQIHNDANQININKIVRETGKTQKEKQQITKKQWIWNIKKTFQQFKLFKNILKFKNSEKILTDIQPRWEKVIKKIDKMQNDEVMMHDLMKKGYQIFISSYLKQSPNQGRLISSLLINILKITLKTNTKNNTNNIIKQILSQRYAYFTFISKKLYEKNIDLQNTSLQQQIKQVNKQYCLKNLQNLFQLYNFTEIQKHGDFHQFKKQYLHEHKITELDKNYKQKINKIKQQYKGKQQQIQKELKILKLQRENKKKKVWKNIEQSINSSPQCNSFSKQLIDITYSMKRMVKYLYLQIKGQQIMDKPTLQNYLNYQNSSGLKQIIHRFQKFSYLRNQKNTYYGELIDQKTKDYLSYDQILEFLIHLKDKGVCKNNKYYKIQYQQQFQQYLQRLKNVIPQKRFQRAMLFSFDLYTQKNQQRIIEQLSEILLNGDQEQRKLTRFKIAESICRQKQNKLWQRFFKSKQINQIAIEKMKLQSMRQHLKGILSQQSKEQVQNFSLFLSQNLQFNDDFPISVQNFIYISKLRNQNKKSLKNIMFGQRLQNQRKIQNRIKEFNKFFQKYKRQYMSEQNLNFLKAHQKVDFSNMEKYLLKCFSYKAIFNHFQKKIVEKSQTQQQFLRFHRVYIKDIIYLLSFIRKLTILYSNFKQLSQQIHKCYQNILDQFYQKYIDLVDLPQNQITLERLNLVFLIDFTSLKTIVNILKKIFTQETFNKQLSSVWQEIIKFNEYQFCLPLFSSDWHNLIQHSELIISPRSNNQTYKKYKTHVSSIQRSQNKEKIEKIKRKGDQQIHLIIQGAAASSQIFCAYYNHLEQAGLSNKIKMITSTSLFGFLMCLGYKLNDIRKEMYKTRNYLLQMLNFERTKQSYYENNILGSLNSINAISDYHKLQVLNIMRIFQQQYQKHNGNVSYAKKFNDIRLIVEQQQRYYIETCSQILDNAIQQIQKIQNNFLPAQKANQIAKKFGFNYICNFQKRHQYSKYNSESKEQFNKMIAEYYQQFGSIISAIACNFISNKVSVSFNLDKTQNFIKGFMIAKLMTAYKLKAYIFQKLQEHDIAYDITLNQLYDNSKLKPILINFVVVNITEKRMDFLNKQTSPNMPVWAAILASSSLPVLHRCFRGEKHWENIIESKTITRQLAIKKIFTFFNASDAQKRKYTLYSSSILISSIPIELLTNKSFPNYKKYITPIGFVFDYTQPTDLFHLKVEKKYFNLSFNLLKLFIKITSKQFIVTSKQQIHMKEHYNRNYQVNYSPFYQVQYLLFNNVTAKIMETLIQSNDNLVFKWYSTRLIRLPIKIGTLSFHKIVQHQILQAFQIKTPSQQAMDAFNRSYEITKTFIEHARFIIQEGKQQIYPTFSPNRLLIKLRAEFIQKVSPKSGFTEQLIKVTFLNHSRWNQNMYSNYVIEYQAKNDSPFKRCLNSEIVWKIEQGPCLAIRFYYPHHRLQKRNNQSKLQFAWRISYSQCILNFRQIIGECRKNSYDYDFRYRVNEDSQIQYQGQQKEHFKQHKQIKPKKLNGIKITKAKNLPIVTIKRCFLQTVIHPNQISKQKQQKSLFYRSYYDFYQQPFQSK